MNIAMNHIYFFRNFIVVVFTICMFTACGNTAFDNDKPSPLKKIVLSESQAAAQRHEMDFAISLFKEVVAREPNKNLMISPFSASLCLSLLASGSAGETYTQMAAILGFADFTREEIGNYYQTMCNGLYEADNSVNLAIANAVWPAKNLQLKSDYAAFTEKWYFAKVTSLDFSSSGSLRIVNDWGKKHTNGLIPKLLDNLDSQTRLLLTNALYFRGKWAGGDMTTSKHTFTDYSGKSSQVQFFGDTRQLYYRQETDFEACRIPYGNGAYSLVVLLPKSGKPVNDIVASLTSSQLRNTVSNMKSPSEVKLLIPSIKTDYSMDDVFMAALKSMGMCLPFSSNADFSGISSEPLSIGKILQKTSIDINEKGAEAAAATTIIMYGASEDEPISFIADRPFIYAIFEHSYNTILFLGIYGGM